MSSAKTPSRGQTAALKNGQGSSEMTVSSTALPRKIAPAPARSFEAELRTQLPLVGGFLLLIALAAGSVWLFASNHRLADSVNHTLQMRSRGYRLLTIVQDAETGQRGYLLTNDEFYLQPYKAAINEAPKAIADLQALAAGSLVQSATVSKLKKLITAKLDELAATVALIEKGDRPGALEIVHGNKGNHYMTTIREVVAEFQAEEQRTQVAQADAVERNNLLLAIASLCGIATIIGFAAYVILASNSATKQLMSAQDDLRHTNENLEGIVAERVQELQVANEEIQRFAYIVSHDLRAPLVNVMGFTSELDATRGDIAVFMTKVEAEAPQLVTPDARMAVDTDLPEALGFIRTSTQKMDRLINAILKLSREGRRVLTPHQIDLAELIKAQGASLTQQLEAGEAELLVQDDLPPINSDRLAIEQIFGNLIENAIKYLSPGRPGRIAVTGKAQGAYLRYDIADNGRGIEAKDFERVFELFRRSGEQNTQGEGIGLAYVRNLARRLGGNVTVQSELGQGSTFTVILPSTFSAKARVK